MSIDSYRFLDFASRQVMKAWTAREKPREIPFTPLAKPLAACTVALVSTAAIARRGAAVCVAGVGGSGSKRVQGSAAAADRAAHREEAMAAGQPLFRSHPGPRVRAPGSTGTAPRPCGCRTDSGSSTVNNLVMLVDLRTGCSREVLNVGVARLEMAAGAGFSVSAAMVRLSVAPVVRERIWFARPR